MEFQGDRKQLVAEEGQSLAMYSVEHSHYIGFDSCMRKPASGAFVKRGQETKTATSIRQLDTNPIRSS